MRIASRYVDRTLHPSTDSSLIFPLLPLQNAQSLQSLPGNGLDMIKLDNYGYSMGSPFQQELLNGQALGMGGGRGTNTMCGLGPGLANGGGHEQGLSPPYSNQSPPHSVQSSLALSPHAYLGELQIGISVIRNWLF